MYYSPQFIAVDLINTSVNQWSLHPWQGEEIPQQLQASLARCGVLHPPLVVEDSPRTFAIVAGKRRVEFVKKHTALTHLHCLVIAPETPPHAILELILTEQASAGPLSLAEKARFMDMAGRMAVPQELQDIFLRRLQLKNGRSTLTNLRLILEQNEIIIHEIDAGRMQERMVSELLSLPAEIDRLALTVLFKELAMGDGQQRKFFNLIRDIAFRHSLSISDFLQQQDIVAIRNHQQMNIPQKIQHLGTLLQRALTPSSTQAEEAFRQRVKELHLPPGHALSHSPSFERDEVTLSITFQSLADCIDYLGQRYNKSRGSSDSPPALTP